MVKRRSGLSRAAHTVRWLAHTPWPVLALDMLRANLVGALFTFAFLRFGMPQVDSITLSQFNALNQLAFGLYLVVAIVVGIYLTIALSMPVLIWHRRRTRLDDEAARRRALNLPTLLTLVNLGLWTVGGFLLAAINLRQSTKDFAIVLMASLIGALVTAVLSFMQTEKVLRPITIAAMANDPANANAPGIATRISVFWAVAVAVPLTVIAALIILQQTAVIDTDAEGLQRPILWMAAAALVFGLLAITRLVRSITDPVKQLRFALNQVRAGNLNVAMKIYDGNDIGLLQAGFNDMVADLRERQELRNLFGRYVGEDVARRAIETGTELGGEERYLGVLFVDIVGSTRLAVNRPPREVVELLNEFFEVVVDVVGRHGGFVNKFQGDAALAIFGAPLEQDDFAGAALAAARDLRVELARRLGDVDMGIGVSAGKAVAGHIGAEQRLEYTVIGDPVNEAARLTELAKDEPTRVLGSARAVFLASDEEASHWEIGEGVELRGRGIETLLARPDIDVAVPTPDLD
ncbi:adenylate/guanylate cyclase domain-containing protein [Gordonia sp. (in: high G+C Gram-positive bacteria)]|uniref:adenylate/guanylate cyclase domain-containing protein n=1 Tax=Gordonia sp. (in: high G+C Gram-positive bacteria) TaxID=84139 RepID=UPI00168F40EB|nr:adenylate/guanylate cyclase domain-containing protein [Gordonia sp. (in: high G+C Gram-positive bacteria)]NLG46525.1 adenylate/guanylate cyclase domain-containing protein [Gordonia sp. (in: high G+C Gram-positive bacteria)]